MAIRLVNPAIRRLWLNCRALAMVLTGRTVGLRELAESYDDVAASYDTSWLVHLREVTDRLLDALPEREYGTIFDLGCGTGHTTSRLACRFPSASIAAVDVSGEMLQRCRKSVASPSITFRCADMLAFLREQEAESVDAIVSAWAIGYSNPARVAAEAARVLRPGGILAFVVNYLDTMQAVFGAFRHCMRTYPEHVVRITIPRFPRNRKAVERMLHRCGFAASRIDEGHRMIRGEHGGEPLLPWLLGTGVLAGFDRMMPLRDSAAVRRTFERRLAARWQPLTHHYVSAVATRNA